MSFHVKSQLEGTGSIRYSTWGSWSRASTWQKFHEKRNSSMACSSQKQLIYALNKGEET